MYLSLGNRDKIENWFYKNIGNISVFNEFEAMITNNDAVNVVVMKEYSNNNAHILIKKPNNTFIFIVSDDRNRIIEMMLDLSNFYFFPSLNKTLRLIDDIMFGRESVYPNNSISDDLSRTPTFLN